MKRTYCPPESDCFQADMNTPVSFILLMVFVNMARIRAKNIDNKLLKTPATNSLNTMRPAMLVKDPNTKPPMKRQDKRPTPAELSTAFENVMKTYDKKFRPLYGEKALQVALNFIVLSFGNIREVEMEFEVDLYFLQLWNDPRFNISGIHHENATIELIGSDVEQIWVPDTIFINSKKSNFHHVTLENRFMTVNLSTGEIVYHARITLTGACHMNLRYYPFDQQICYIALESYGHDRIDIQYQWFTRGCNDSCGLVYIYERNLANFEIIEAVKTLEKTIYHTENFSSATGKFVFQRKTTYFLLQVYLPCILIVMVSWASFWIHEEAVPARAAICVTTILTIITMLGVVNVNMPKVSYVKAVDFYLFISFLMVFLSLLEYIIVLNLEAFCKRRLQKKKNDSFSNNHKSHSVVVKVCDDSISESTYLNGYSDYENNTRKRGNIQNGKSHFTLKLNNSKGSSITDHLSKESQEMLLEELMMLKEPSAVDVVSRLLFPLLFIVFNLCYWLVYLDQSHLALAN
ncbi:glycine receptor subunit alphaZ1-like isoform X2 [Rhopilema esculentum]